MAVTKKNIDAKGVLEDVMGCKWSLSVLLAVRMGVNRPGTLERHIEGISAKVLSERLKKLTRYQVLERHEYAEIPPRVEYTLSAQGRQLIDILDAIKKLDEQWTNRD